MHYRLLFFCNILVVNGFVYTMELADLSTANTLTLQLQDHKSYRLDQKIAQFSKTLSDLIAESSNIDLPIPLPNISQETMDWIRNQLNLLGQLKDQGEESNEILDKFLKTVSKNIAPLNGQRVCDLLNAVNYLDIPRLYGCLMEQCDVRKLSEDQLCSLPLDLCRNLIVEALVKEEPLDVGEEGLLNEYNTNRSIKDLCICDNSIISVNFRGYVNIFDLKTGEWQEGFVISDARSGQSFLLTCVCAVHDRIAIGCGPTIRVLNRKTNNEQNFCNGHTAEVSSVVLVNTMLISGSHDNSVRIWDLNSREQIGLLEGHEDSVTSVCVVDNKIISGSQDQTVRVWDLTTRRQLFVCKDPLAVILGTELRSHGSIVTDICTTENKIFSSSSDGTIGIWDLTSGKQLDYRPLSGTDSKLDGIYMNFRPDPKARLHYLVRSGKKLSSVCVASDMIIAGSEDGTLYVWGPHSLKNPLLACKRYNPRKIPTAPIKKICVAGEKIVCGSGFKDGETISLWNLSMLKIFNTLNYTQIARILTFIKDSSNHKGFSFRMLLSLIQI